MFNKTTLYYAPQREISSNIKITEKRAPTDESIKLLREMEEKVLERVLSRIELKNNNFEGDLTFLMSVGDWSVEAYLVFELNGKKITVESSERMAEDVIDKLIKKICEATALKIAQEIINPCLANNDELISVQEYARRFSQ